MSDGSDNDDDDDDDAGLDHATNSAGGFQCLSQIVSCPAHQLVLSY